MNLSPNADIIKTIKMNIDILKSKDRSFNEEDYYIELGTWHVAALMSELALPLPYPTPGKDTECKFCGIKIVENITNPYSFKVWKDITMREELDIPFN